MSARCPVDVLDVTRTRVTFYTDVRHTLGSETVCDLYAAASRSDAGRAKHAGHVYFRDDLQGLVSSLVEKFPCQCPEHWRSGADWPGLIDRDGLLFCVNCNAANDDNPLEG